VIFKTTIFGDILLENISFFCGSQLSRAKKISKIDKKLIQQYWISVARVTDTKERLQNNQFFVTPFFSGSENKEANKLFGFGLI
jgi:hypothetical protein